MGKLKNSRREHDHYPTPAGLARAGIKLISEFLCSEYQAGIRVLEPGCGDAQPYLTAARDLLGHTDDRDTYVGVDIRPVASACSRFQAIGDANFEFWAASCEETFDLIVTNPPFCLATQIVTWAMPLLAQDGVLMILARQSLHRKTEARRYFWEVFPPTHVATISPRPSFIGDGKTDGSEYCYYVWAPWRDREKRRNLQPAWTTLGWLDWEK